MYFSNYEDFLRAAPRISKEGYVIYSVKDFIYYDYKTVPEISGVYSIFSTKTKYIYIGSSQNIRERVHAHMTALKSGIHTISKMQDDYNTYPDSFRICILWQDMSGVYRYTSSTARSRMENVLICMYPFVAEGSYNTVFPKLSKWDILPSVTIDLIPFKAVVACMNNHRTFR